jgi:23S rRNA (cytosine1962-C5)-methyltransferase
VPESGAGPVRRGHPWVFRDVTVASKAGRPVVLVDERRKNIGWGLADDGPIAIRVLGTSVPDDLRLEKVIVDRIAACDAFRRRVVGAETDAYRLVHGEGDGLGGLVIDRYADLAVVKLYGACWVPHLATIVEALRGLPWMQRAIRRLGVARVDGRDGAEVLVGDAVPDRVLVWEHGMRMIAPVRDGQKTGMFLDQREHRQLVRRWAGDGLVANLFSYHGGFSVAAALGGAKRVVSVDVAPAAMELAKENFRLNGLDPDRHGFVVADAFTWKPDHPVDTLIVDPPSLAHDRKTAPAAKAAYRKLHRHLGPLVAPRGVLVTSSCTAWVPEAEWRGTVEEGLSGAWSWCWSSAGPPDHPVAKGHPEGAYLKFAMLRRR